jgi:uroporphyrinogen decarboxylase
MSEGDRAAESRFLRACRGEPVDATPVWYMRQAGRSLPEYRAIRRYATLADIVADPALCVEVTLQPVRRHGVDAAILFADITTPLPGIGIDVEIVDGVGPVIAHPVRDRAALERLRAFEAESAVASLLEAIGLLRRELDVPLIGFAGAPFTLAAYIVDGRAARDALGIKRLLHADPGLGRDLLGRVTDMTIRYLGAQVEAGVQVVQVFDSWVGVLSPPDYDRHVAPHMARLFAALRDLGVPAIHFGTGGPGLLPRMAAAGGDVLGVDWRIALSDAAGLLPGRVLQGNLDPVAVLAPWEELERQAGWVLSEAGPLPGHIFNLGHGLHPESDADQVTRLTDLVHTRTAAGAPA